MGVSIWGGHFKNQNKTKNMSRKQQTQGSDSCMAHGVRHKPTMHFLHHCLCLWLCTLI